MHLSHHFMAKRIISTFTFSSVRNYWNIETDAYLFRSHSSILISFVVKNKFTNTIFSGRSKHTHSHIPIRHVVFSQNYNTKNNRKIKLNMQIGTMRGRRYWAQVFALLFTFRDTDKTLYVSLYVIWITINMDWLNVRLYRPFVDRLPKIDL